MWQRSPPPALASPADNLDPGDDSAANTHNELVHGGDQLHDLRAVAGVADTDWYRLSQKPFSSYEVLVDTTSSSISPNLKVQLVDSGGTVLKTSSAVSTFGHSRSLRFSNENPSPIDNQYIRVFSEQCTTGCTANDVYRIRFFNTTQPMARFNNTGTQYSYVIAQNPTDYTITARMYFWDANGSLLCTTHAFTLGPKDEAVIDDDRIYIHGDNLPFPSPCESGNGIEGVAGHGKLISDARYGDLRARAATVDPDTTLLEFETDMPSRPY